MMTPQTMESESRLIEGSWEYEAWRVAMLFRELGMAPDDENLLFYDVRELITLRLRLQEALKRPQPGRLTRRGSPRWPRFAPRRHEELRKNAR